MAKYLIQYDAGFGQNAYVAEAKSQIAADDIAHDAAHEVFEDRAIYSAKPLTPELAKEFGVTDELESVASSAAAVEVARP